jgi:tripeptide aminopeptidase
MSKKEIVDLFTDLVKIDSPSGKEEKVARYIADYLKNIGIKSSRDRFGNLLAKVEGEGEPMIYSAHMDTVQPGEGINPVIKGDLIKSDGKTILGGDDKAGITAILLAVKRLKEKNIRHYPIELIFTGEEETGLKGAFNLDFKNIKSKIGIVADSSRPLGHITIAAPFIFNMDIEIKGKGAHAGAFPEKGISAIQIAAKAIGELRLGRINSGTTCNIGLIEGGSARNSIPETVSIKAEARSHYREQAEEQVELFRKAFTKWAKKYKAKLVFKSKYSCPGYAYSKSDKFIKKIAEQNALHKFKTVYERSGGASDSNVYAGKNIRAIDISYGGADVHTVNESVKISEIGKLAAWLFDFAKR